MQQGFQATILESYEYAYSYLLHGTGSNSSLSSTPNLPTAQPDVPSDLFPILHPVFSAWLGHVQP